MVEFHLPEKTLFGEGAVGNLGKEAGRFSRKCFVMSYGRTRGNRDWDRIQRILADAEISAVRFQDVEADPSIQTIDRAAELMKSEECGAIIAIGGGSVLDAAKAVALLQTNPGSARDYQMGNKQIANATAPVIAVPTTAGTGSEATKITVITNKEEHIKKSIVHPYLVPRVAIVDPALMISVPPAVTAATGTDALAHSLEAYVSTGSHAFTDAVAERGVELVAGNLEAACRNGTDMTARANMAFASYLGGLALNAGAGLGHLLAHPLGAIGKIPHGEALAVIMVQVMRANLGHAAGKYARLAPYLAGKDVSGLDETGRAEAAVDGVAGLLRRIGLTRTLKDYGVTEKDFPAMVESAHKSTFHIKTNPRPVDDALLLEVLGKS